MGNTNRAQDLLLERARRGDRTAFGQLVLPYQGRIFALALHLTGNASDAEDIVQETLLRAYRHLPEFQGRSQFAAWLYRIAVNRALSHRRRRTTDRVRLDDDRVRAAVAVDAAGDPHQAAQLAQTYARLLTALDALSPPLRATVVLVALQGLSHRQAAAIEATTEGTIAWRMHEARRQLQGALREGRTPSAKADHDASGIRRKRPTPSALRKLVNRGR